MEGVWVAGPLCQSVELRWEGGGGKEHWRRTLLCFLLYAEIGKYEYKCLLIRGSPVRECVCGGGDGGGGAGGGGGGSDLHPLHAFFFFSKLTLHHYKFAPQICIFLALILHTPFSE